MDELEIKKQLVEIVKSKLTKSLTLLKKSMNSAQQDANEHKGAMESRYDTFKEEAQALRDGFALQIQRTADVLAGVQQMRLRVSPVVEAGAVIVTEEGAYFVSTGLIDEPLEVNGIEYECVNPNAPIVQKLRGKSAADFIEMAGRKIKILRVF